MREDYSLDISDKETDEFWSLVTFALANLLGDDHRKVSIYRSYIDEGPFAERMLILHDDPFRVALDITDRKLSSEDRRAYLMSANRFTIVNGEVRRVDAVNSADNDEVGLRI